jgi:polyisoprenyl-phosphate glycosyltransferase
MLSIISPAHNEAQNLPVLRKRLETIIQTLFVEWEWIIVDDGSNDDTYNLVRQWAATELRIRGVRLSRNYGSHGALACGIKLARGDAIAFLAADLQDPPEILKELFSRWLAGSKVVWALQQQRPHTGLHTLFYSMLRRADGLTDQPLEGGDMVLMDRSVIEVLIAREERNSNIFARIRLAGFTQDKIFYHKEVRRHGNSSWTLMKKLKLAIDSLIGFDYSLVRAMTCLGLIVTIAGLALIFYALLHVFCTILSVGWSLIMAVILILGGIQMIFLGLLGEYAWRTLDEIRGRPLYVVEALTWEEPCDKTSGQGRT